MQKIGMKGSKEQIHEGMKDWVKGNEWMGYGETKGRTREGGKIEREK